MQFLHGNQRGPLTEEGLGVFEVLCDGNALILPTKSPGIEDRATTVRIIGSLPNGLGQFPRRKAVLPV